MSGRCVCVLRAAGIRRWGLRCSAANLAALRHPLPRPPLRPPPRYPSHDHHLSCLIRPLPGSGGRRCSRSCAFPRPPRCVQSNIVLLTQAFRKKFVIPDFQSFCAHIDDLYDNAKSMPGGQASGRRPPPSQPQQHASYQKKASLIND